MNYSLISSRMIELDVPLRAYQGICIGVDVIQVIAKVIRALGSHLIYFATFQNFDTQRKLFNANKDDIMLSVQLCRLSYKGILYPLAAFAEKSELKNTTRIEFPEPPILSEENTLIQKPITISFELGSMAYQITQLFLAKFCNFALELLCIPDTFRQITWHHSTYQINPVLILSAETQMASQAARDNLRDSWRNILLS